MTVVFVQNIFFTLRTNKFAFIAKIFLIYKRSEVIHSRQICSFNDEVLLIIQNPVNLRVFDRYSCCSEITFTF